MMNKKLAIVNRKCAEFKKPAYIRSIVGFLERKEGADVVFTKYPGHARDIAGKASGYNTIISAGGDGTISEVVNGMNMAEQSLGIIPLGTGNSVARHLDIAAFKKSVDIIRKGFSTKVDLIRCAFKMNNAITTRYAVATTGMGYILETADLGNRRLKGMGALCYPIAASCKLFNQAVISAKVRINDSHPEKINFTVLVVNNTSYSGNFRIFSKADLGDGRLNLFFAKTNAIGQLLHDVSILIGLHFFNPGHLREIGKLHLSLDRPARLMLDGEMFGPVEEASFEVLPQALRLIGGLTPFLPVRQAV